MRNPWESDEGRQVWKTKAEYYTWLRGAIRRMWKDYPIRKVWKRGSLRGVTQQERAAKVFHPSTKNVGQCVYCKEWLAGSKLESDHILPSNGCTSKETAEEFLWHNAGLTGESFQLICKPCHKVKSYSEKMGVPFEEAFITKKAILVEKGTPKEWLAERGVEPGSNHKVRRQQIIQKLKEEG